MRRITLGIVLLILSGVSNADDAPKPLPVEEPELRAELIRRVKADQDSEAQSPNGCCSSATANSLMRIGASTTVGIDHGSTPSKRQKNPSP